MQKPYFYIIMMLTFFSFIITISSCDDETEQNRFEYYSPDEQGPFNTGFRELTWTDTERDRSESLAVWYPCMEEPNPEYGYAVDGAPDSSAAPYPLIMFSHGSGGINQQSTFFTIFLASHGYVVIAPNHPGNTLFYNDSDLLGDTAINRPLDISFCIDEAISMNSDSGSFLHNMIDENLIGQAGHSFGGYTTLALSGAFLDVESGLLSCDENPDMWGCHIASQIKEIYPDADYIDESDSRIKASIAMAPARAGLISENSITDIDIPVMVTVGDLDEATPLDTNAQPVYDGMYCEKYMVRYEPGTHGIFTDLCGGMGTPSDYCPDAFNYINLFGAAFYGYHLKNISKYSEFLTEEFAQSLNQVIFEHEEFRIHEL